ncbi:MAG: hypothetical protein H0T58_06130 [Gemmatimonadales bacterium]|nr:hypothetical protein [Gemmatimonadales bacterium]
MRSLLLATFAGCLLLACSDGSGPGDGPALVCTAGSTEALSVGEHRVLNPLQDDACLRLPPPPGAGAEHLYVPVATEGEEAQDGVSAPFALNGSAPATASAPAPTSARLSAFRQAEPAETFHDMLRQRERVLTGSPSRVLFDKAQTGSVSSVPPVPGEQRTFDVCTSRQCNAFTQATATAKAVGQRVAIFVDNDAPAGGYSDADLAQVGTLFDDYLYPIDTVAFGRESDVDGNAVVIVLLTHRVNALSPNCNTTGSVILGYFFGADLLPRSSGNPGSNEAEIFYGLVPDPGNLDCTISQEFARSRLPATFIHEFQHMISFNQHVLVRNGRSEDTWLNEGLSHLAEELGGRQIPNAECPVSGSCVRDFIQGDLENALDYLTSPENFFLIEPGSSSGDLAERGANWLFVRWLADQFATDTLLGTDLTRRLVGTSLTGVANVQAVTGQTFQVLIPEWQLANFVDDLPGFQAASPRLRYKTWNFRAAADSIARTFPLVPDATNGVGYSYAGVLRAGSGRHVLIAQPGAASSVDLRLTAPSGQEPVASSVQPRIALVRIR